MHVRFFCLRQHGRWLRGGQQAAFVFCFDLVLIHVAGEFWNERKKMNHKQGPLAETPDEASAHMKKAAPGLARLLDSVTTQEYPDMTEQAARLKYEQMAEALSLAKQLSMTGTVDMGPWKCVGVEFIHTLPPETQQKLEQIKKRWFELYAWILTQLALSGSTTIFHVPDVDDAVMDPDIVWLVNLLHFGPLLDCQRGYVSCS
jgi:hypothetical protein